MTARTRTCMALVLLSVCGLTALAWASLASPLPRLVYNASDSMAVGWYRVDPPEHRAGSLSRALHVGSLVLVRLPADAAALAAQRGYLPAHVPLLKLVRAVAPQKVCVTDGIVRVDGLQVVAALSTDRMGRPLHAWPFCRQLRPDELFLLSVTNGASFDSRYFGPVRASAVLGIALPIWLKAKP